MASLREAIRKKIPQWKKSAERIKEVEKDLEIFKIGQIVENPEGSLFYFKGFNIFQKPTHGGVDRSLLALKTDRSIPFDESTSTKEIYGAFKKALDAIKEHILLRDKRMSEHIQNINRCEIHPIFRIDNIEVEVGFNRVELKVYWEYGAVRLESKRRSTRKMVI